MLIENGYDRNAVLEYAKTWAYTRNPRYFDFEHFGGDCTNFASQCVFAGCNAMNYSPNGWFYLSSSNRSPSWTSVETFCNFLITNQNIGPYGKIVNRNEIKVGDIIQLKNFLGAYYHSLVVVSISYGEIFVAAHTFDVYNKPLSLYNSLSYRYLHVLGSRK